MPIFDPEPGSQLLGTAQPDRSALDIDQQAWATECSQRRLILHPTIRHHQQSMPLCRIALLPQGKPLAGLIKRRKQRRATASPEAVQPGLQRFRSLQTLVLPAGRTSSGSQQRQSHPATISVIEHLSERTFSEAQRLMTSRGSRGVDDDQPHLTGLTAARLSHQVAAQLRPPTQQSGDPGNGAVASVARRTAFASFEQSRARIGIRPQGCVGADA